MDDANVTDKDAPDLPPSDRPADTPSRIAQRAGLRLVDDDADGLQLADDGTVRIRYTRNEERWEAVCRPPTLDAYATIIDAIEEGRDRLADMRDQANALRAEVEQVAPEGEDITPDVDRELWRLKRKWERTDTADKVEIRRMAFDVLALTVRLTADQELPDDAPVWVTMWGAVDVMLSHWEAVPFRGPAGNQQPSGRAGTPKRS